MTEQTYIHIMPTLEETLRHNQVDPNSYKPAYGGESVGLDLYYTGTERLLASRGTTVLVPTGLKIHVPRGWGAFIWGRGKITKTTLFHKAGVIDPGYSGEIFVAVATHIDSLAGGERIEPQSKLPFQLVVQRCLTDFELVDETGYAKLHNQSARLDNKIGSSDKT
jgi:dUTPase